MRPPRIARSTNGGNDVVVREDEVGFSASRACFPSVSSCLTITGVSPVGLHTAHVTSGSRTDNLRIASVLSALNAANCSDFYVVGPLEMFTSNVAGSDFNSVSAITRSIKTVASEADIRFVDTAPHGPVHVYVEQDSDAVQILVSSSETPGNQVQANQYPDSLGKPSSPDSSRGTQYAVALLLLWEKCSLGYSGARKSEIGLQSKLH